MARETRRHEKPVRESIHVSQYFGPDVCRAERENRSFRAPTDRARNVESGGTWAAPRENETRQPGEPLLHRVNGSLEKDDAVIGDEPAKFRSGGFASGCDLRAETEEVALNLLELASQRVVRAQRFAADAERRVQLVDIAVGHDARIVLRNSGASEERCFPRVPGKRVDLHPLFLSSRYPRGPMKRKTFVLQGKKISGGIAVGRARVRLDDLSVVPAYRLTNDAEVEAEIGAFRQAIDAAEHESTKDLEWARGNLPELEAEIFAAQRGILRDPSLVDWVESRIREHRENAASAVRRRFDEFRSILGESASEIIRSRVQDVTDAERLILSHLLGQPMRHSASNGEEWSGEPVILITHSPPPSLLVHIDPGTVAGLLCEGGGKMGHVAVLARALNLPTLIQVEGLLRGVRDGDIVAIEADDERVVVNPAPDELEAIRVRERKRKMLLPPAPTDPRSQRRTADGRRISLLGNVASPRDVDAAAQIDADGIGLFRTEYAYLAKNRLPTEAELVLSYGAVAVAFAKDPVDIRLLDVGSEKHLPGISHVPETNPALGLRSMRFLFENPSILRTQLRAILQAAAEGPVRLLLPMVGGVEDVRRVRELVWNVHEDLRREGVRHNPDIAVGAMIEHPAAVAMAPEIFQEADFVSVGTNDLAMYVLAVDRDAAHLAAYSDPMHPAFLRVLRGLARVAEEAGKQLSLCGEIAGDPSLTGFLVGLGYTRLSMAPQWILPVGLMLASIDSVEWTRVADEAAAAPTAEDVRRILREFQDSF